MFLEHAVHSKNDDNIDTDDTLDDAAYNIDAETVGDGELVMLLKLLVMLLMLMMVLKLL